MTALRGRPAARRLGPEALVSAGTLASRLLAVAREALFAATLGAGPATDALVTALRIPSAARDLFAEGALSAGLVPALAAERARAEPGAPWRLADAALGWTLVSSAALVLAGALGAPALVRLLAPGFAPELASLAAGLTRLAMPFLGLVALSALAMALLHAHGRFGAPAAAPALFNLALVGVGAVVWLSGARGARAAALWAGATLAGGVLQLAALLPALRATGWRPRPRLTGSARAGLGRLVREALPGALGLSAMQVNLVVGNAFASRSPSGVSWLAYAFPLVQLPLGVFALGIATVAAVHAAAREAEGDAGAAADAVREALGRVAFYAVPSAAGLALLAGPICALLYQRGAFRAADTAGTATALVAYAPGLVAYAGVRVLAPAFYAAGKARVPVAAAAGSVGLHALLAWQLGRSFGHLGVAAAATLAAWFQVVTLASAWRARARRAGVEGVPPRAAVVQATLALAAACLLARWGVERGLGSTGAGLAGQAVRALLPVLAGSAAYLGVALRLRAPEAQRLIAGLRGR